MFQDSHTFDTPEAIECRGIAFGIDGKIVSRPLHKFFNMGEKSWLTPDELLKRDDVVAIYDKLDGSMIATSYHNGKLEFRSKKTFNSDVAVEARKFVTIYPNTKIYEFCKTIAKRGMTAIFELTSPDHQIVVTWHWIQLRLLHVRDNVTGEYVMLDPNHPIHDFIAEFEVPMIKQHNITLQEVIDSLPTMTNAEGYVVQFTSGDMVKIKCPWYVRLHRSVSMLRERDIAKLALYEELDDIKLHLTELGIDLKEVEEIETRVKAELIHMQNGVDGTFATYGDLSRKEFAIKFKDYPTFRIIDAEIFG
jgi:RNA ligase